MDLLTLSDLNFDVALPCEINMHRIRAQLKIVRDVSTNQNTILYDQITADAFAHAYIVGRIGKEDSESSILVGNRREDKKDSRLPRRK
jgi:hypothetical protein